MPRNRDQSKQADVAELVKTVLDPAFVNSKAQSWVLGLALFAAAAAACSEDAPRRYGDVVCSRSAAGELYEQRILPLLSDDRPKSCNECHLSGIDLSIFERRTPCESMACLREQGLVNFEQPEDSRILQWIRRADPKSPLITAEVIDEEYEGFLEWIRFSAACGSDACGKASCSASRADLCGTQDEPTLEEVLAAKLPTSCSDLQVERLFRDSVYRSRGRCFPCHFDSEGQLAGNPPRWIHASGDCTLGSLETLRHIERRGLLNLERPELSLLLTKPLAIEAGGVAHGGADKFHDDQDPAYINYLRFVRYYADCKTTGEAPASSSGWPDAGQSPPDAGQSSPGTDQSPSDAGQSPPDAGRSR